MLSNIKENILYLNSHHLVKYMDNKNKINILIYINQI